MKKKATPMNLPKYIPGIIAIVQEDNPKVTETGQIMFAISHAFIDHEEWHYENHDSTMQAHEHEIVGIINNGVFVPADKFTGVITLKEAGERLAEQDEAIQADLRVNEEEQKFIDEQFEKHQAELKKAAKKVTKIKVQDGKKGTK